MSTPWRRMSLPALDPDRLVLPGDYAGSYRGTLLARPVVVSDAQAHRTGEDLLALLRLLVDLPDRLTRGIDGFAERIRVPAALRPLVTQGDPRRLPLYARADLLDDGSTLRLLELNVGSELGGVDAAQMNRAWLADPAFAAATDDWQLTHVDTTALTAGLLRRAGARVGRSAPRCALVEARGTLADHAHVFVALREAIADHGIDLELTEIQELHPRDDGGTDLHGEPVDVVLRYFAAHEIVDDPQAVATYAHLERADATDRTGLVGSLVAHCLASKAALGVLHAPATREVLTADERALVDRLVPWTALLADLDDAAFAQIAAARTDHVLKPGIGYSGVGTVVGDAVDDTTWREALHAGRSGDVVVQRRVHPAGELVLDPHTGVADEWHANWGVFVTEQGWSGGFVRALRPQHGSVIGYANGGTRGAPIFTSALDDAPPGHPLPGDPATDGTRAVAADAGAVR